MKAPYRTLVWAASSVVWIAFAATGHAGPEISPAVDTVPSAESLFVGEFALVIGIATVAGLVAVFLGVLAIAARRQNTRLKKEIAEREEISRRLAENERELREQSDLLRLTLENMGQGISVMDENFRPLLWNRLTSELSGVPLEMYERRASAAEMVEYQRTLPPPYVHIESNRRENKNFKERAIDGERGLEDYYERPGHKPGMWIGATTRWMPDGKTVRIYQDISLRKQAEDSIRESEGRLRAVIDNSPNEIYLKDVSGRYTLVNRAVADHQGHTPEAMVGLTAYDRYPRDLADLIADQERKVLETRAPCEQEVELPVKGGDSYVGQMVKFPVMREDGEIFAVGTITTNIAVLKKAEQGLQEAVAESRKAQRLAEEANRAKSDFLSNMSHELRTPLNAIIGFTDFVSEDKARPVHEQHRNSLGYVLRASRHLLNLIDDVLDLARIESSAISLAPEAVDAGEVIDECLSLTRALAAPRNITVSAAVAEDPLPLIHVDRTRFKQVLLNLLSNAVKYNRDGGRVVVETGPAAAERLSFAVRDTGPGIAPDLLEHLFDPFDRLGAENSGIEGTGIGLTITKRLVEQMGGSIAVESTVGEGSVFRIGFPLSSETVAASSLRAEEDSSADVVLSGHILYVEDNPANLELVRRILSRHPDVEFSAAPTAEIGIATARSAPPDVILMDIDLPGMDGFEALGELAATAETSQVPVIAVTAAATQGEVRRGQASGFFDYLTKPIAAKRLVATIARALGVAPMKGPASIPDAAARPNTDEVKVLVVDDVPFNLAVAQMQLGNLGIACEIADDPSKALEMLKTGEFALALVDIGMPGMNGIELTEKLRRAERETGIETPVIALTANAGSEQETERFRQAGMNDRLTKPVDLKVLAAVLQRWLPAARAGTRAGTGAALADPASTGAA